MSGQDVVRGSVKWWNTQKGYGFILMPDGDVFIHANQLRKSGIVRSLVEGEEVTFVMSSGDKGKFATQIKPVKP